MVPDDVSPDLSRADLMNVACHWRNERDYYQLRVDVLDHQIGLLYAQTTTLLDRLWTAGVLADDATPELRTQVSNLRAALADAGRARVIAALT